MNDLISRVALLDDMPKNDELLSLDVRRVICAAPAVDAVPVVRCRECKHARPLAQDGYVSCILWSRASNIDGFCHMGARMDGGGRKDVRTEKRNTN